MILATFAANKSLIQQEVILDSVSVALVWIAVTILLIQSACVIVFIVFLYRRPVDSGDSGDCAPPAAVILCLRGADPFLGRCLRALLDQDYPNYALHVVLDHTNDPAAKLVNELEPHPRLSVETLRAPGARCSLKCSSLVQAIGNLESSVEVVALCDADVVPHRTWLRELAAPLANPAVGVTTGNRWFAPTERSGASAVRFLWNVPAALNMVLLRIAWGGSLAIKRNVIDETQLLEKWSKAFCEDTMLFRELRRSGYRQVFVPSVMIFNREACDFGGLISWIPRQLLTARLYHPSWLATVGYGIISSLIPFMACGVAIVALLQMNWPAFGKAMLALGVFEAGNLALVLICDRVVRSRNAAREQMPHPSLAHPSLLTDCWRLPLWILVSQFISPLCFIKAIFLRSVNWRGIEYRIRGQEVLRGEHVPASNSQPDLHSL